MNLESLAKKTTAQREHPPSRFKSFKIGCGGSARYDKIKADVAFRKEVANSCGVGFDVPANLGSIEPIEPKLESHAVASNI